MEPRPPDGSGTGTTAVHPDRDTRARHARWQRRSTRTAELLGRAAHTERAARRRDLIAEVVEANMGVADAIAARYRGRGVSDEDLRQVAYLALTKAATRFDADAGHDFLSFAVPTIRGELRRYFRDHGWMVRPPRKVQELQSRMFAAESELAMTLGRSPSVSEVARRLGESESDVAEALAAEGCFTPVSLDRPIVDDADATIGDLLGEPDLSRAAVEARVMLAPVVRRLDERDRRILQLRFFEDRTQREIAEEIGVTQTQVSRVLNRIIRSLRAELDDPEAGESARSA